MAARPNLDNRLRDRPWNDIPADPGGHFARGVSVLADDFACNNRNVELLFATVCYD